MSEQDAVRRLETTWNPWTIAALVDRSSKRRRRETEGEDELDMDAFRGDMGLHMVVVVCDVSMEVVVDGMGRLLRWGSPPACDLTEFLLQYCSSS